MKNGYKNKKNKKCTIKKFADYLALVSSCVYLLTVISENSLQLTNNLTVIYSVIQNLI